MKKSLVLKANTQLRDEPVETALSVYSSAESKNNKLSKAVIYKSANNTGLK
jgi:hypothetical protein